MKRIICILMLSLIFAVASQAQSASAQSKDEKDVAAAVDVYCKAMVDADKNLLEKIAAPEISYGHSSGLVQDKAAFVNGVINDPIDFLTAEVSNQMIRVAGNTALVRHTFKSKATNNGKPSDINIQNLLVWQKQKGEWKLLARQAFRLPTPAPTN
ncbi:nuclear transport factor 2 family protein [Adhaeribacter aquaticus]|uniref:nuclear transport factor 2 family protein n=1 Tax=Adhaeribacter aquaticus TaxID=299567 RepID=UPI000553DACC|nr:nuclear transport factor 2 family protein [Adhaeribacter aquaticus]